MLDDAVAYRLPVRNKPFSACKMSPVQRKGGIPLQIHPGTAAWSRVPGAQRAGWNICAESLQILTCIKGRWGALGDLYEGLP